MKVKQLIEELQKFPEDTTAEVVVDVNGGQEWPTLRSVRIISKVYEKDSFVIWLR